MKKNPLAKFWTTYQERRYYNFLITVRGIRLLQNLSGVEWNELFGFEFWPGSLCFVVGQDTLLLYGKAVLR